MFDLRNVKTQKYPTIFSFCNLLCPFWGCGVAGAYPGYSWVNVGYALNKRVTHCKETTHGKNTFLEMTN